jgi:hypothetical protein
MIKNVLAEADGGAVAVEALAGAVPDLPSERSMVALVGGDEGTSVAVVFGFVGDGVAVGGTVVVLLPAAGEEAPDGEGVEEVSEGEGVLEAGLSVLGGAVVLVALLAPEPEPDAMSQLPTPRKEHSLNTRPSHSVQWMWESHTAVSRAVRTGAIGFLCKTRDAAGYRLVATAASALVGPRADSVNDRCAFAPRELSRLWADSKNCLLVADRRACRGKRWRCGCKQRLEHLPHILHGEQSGTHLA